MDDGDIRVAWLALIVSLLVAGWQVLQHWLQGARVKVRMSPGYWDEYGLARDKTWQHLEGMTRREGGWPLEVAIVHVENRGRLAVTVSTPGLAMRSTRMWRRTPRHTATPRLLPAQGISRELRVRLEPYDSVTFVFDVWQALNPIRKSAYRPPRPLRVRAAMEVAGRRRVKRSSLLRSWKVHEGQLAFTREPVEIGLAAHRALDRWWGHMDVSRMASRGMIIPVALAIRERHPVSGRAPNADDLKALIEDVWLLPEKPIAHMTSFYVAEELVPYYAEPPTLRQRSNPAS